MPTFLIPHLKEITSLTLHFLRSLQHITDQLEARALELASLQSKVEERNQSTLKEKQAMLEAKERDLKSISHPQFIFLK